jgi:hypothetical protein
MGAVNHHAPGGWWGARKLAVSSARGRLARLLPTSRHRTANFRMRRDPTKFTLWDAHPVSVRRLSMPLAAAPSPPSWSPQPR